MLSQAVDIRYELTSSALEAAIIEADCIKENNPPYNKALKSGDRAVVFTNRRLDGFCLELTADCPIGPLPSRNCLEPIIHMLNFQKQAAPLPTEPPVISGILGIPASSIPDQSCFNAGINEFRRRYGHYLKEGRELMSLLSLGHLLHHNHQLQLPPDTADEEPSDTPEEWTPDLVRELLESNWRFGARMLRRCFWFPQLSNSILVWQKKGSKTGQRNCAVISGGRLIQSAVLEKSDAPPMPKRRYIDPLLAKSQIDISSYDRLRVLTTEVRRLVTTNRLIALKMKSGPVLNQSRVSEILGWL